jgi:hypothetical protein
MLFVPAKPTSDSAALCRSMADTPSRFVVWFRLIYVFNAWILSVTAGLVACLAWAASAGGVEAVPAWLWLATIVDGALFACYFLLSSPVAERLDGRVSAGPLSRLVRTLERWDEAGRGE